MQREVPVTEARKDLAELVNQVAYRGERIVLTRHGKAMAAIVSAEELELLDRLLAERIDLTQAGPAASAADQRRPAQATPLRIAAEYRPSGPSSTPGFSR
jgi:prevent-host-death family protein